MYLQRVLGGSLCLLAVLLTITIAPSAAQDDPDEPVIAVIDLRSRRATSGATLLPVEIAVQSRGRALDGTLLLEAQESPLSWEIGVQLAANTEATQSIVVPVSPFGGLDLDASLIVGGEEVATADLSVNDPRDGDRNAVGLIGLDPPGPSIDLAPDVGTAALYELSNLDLVEALDSVVVSPAGMRSLSADEQQVLLNWVGAGGQLVVADGPGSIDDQLPVVWQADGSVSMTGAGFIRYVGSEWQDAVPVGPTIASNPQASQFSSGGHNELKSDAGFRVPGIGIIASILGVYMVLAGPVLFAVLAARNRQKLAWVVLPALAVGFTVGVVVTGNVLTRGRGNGHATIVEVSPVGAALTDTLLIAESGEQTVLLPSGYTLAGSGLGSTGGQAGSPVTLKPTPGADDLVFEIDQGSGGTAIVRGQTNAYADALQISNVRTSSDEITGSVTNNTGSDLSEVVAILGNRVAEIGALANQSTADFSIDLQARARQVNPELRVWGINNQFGEGGFRRDGSLDDGPLNGSAWMDWRNSRNGTSTPTGLVTVVGWTRDVNASLLGGQGRTAFIARQTLGAVSGPVALDAIRTVPLRVFDPFGFGFEFEFEFGGFGGDIDHTFQYIRPADSDTSNVGVQIENVASQVQVWLDGEWRDLELPERGRVDTAIPDELWVDDVLWVRAVVEGGFFDPSIVPIELTEIDPGTDALPVLPSGETSRRQTFDEFNGEVPIELEAVNDVELDENDEFAGQGDIFNSFDQWLIELSDGDEVTVSMDALNQGGLDPYLVIRNPEGRQIAENDDFNGLNSRVVFTADGNGVHTIETRPLSGGGPGGSYEVTISVERGDPVESTTTTEPAAVSEGDS